MEKLKEFAGVIVAVVTMTTALASLGLWAIHVQINPEIRRLDGRVESLTERVDRMEDRMEARFDRIEGEIKTIRDDIKIILLRLPEHQETS